MRTMIKKNWSILLLLITVFAVSVYFVGKKKGDDKIKLSVKTFAINNGWGYNVLANDSIYIHQEFIPAIESNKNFISQQQAETIASLVVKKIKGKQSPAISLYELDSCKINY